MTCLSRPLKFHFRRTYHPFLCQHSSEDRPIKSKHESLVFKIEQRMKIAAFNLDETKNWPQHITLSGLHLNQKLIKVLKWSDNFLSKFLCRAKPNSIIFNLKAHFGQHDRVGWSRLLFFTNVSTFTYFRSCPFIWVSRAPFYLPLLALTVMTAIGLHGT